MAMFSALMGTTIGLLFVHNQISDFSISVLMTVFLAFPLFVAIELLAENRGWNTKNKVLSNAVGVVILCAYYFWLPSDLSTVEVSVVLRSVLWFISFGLLIFVAPFIRKDEGNLPHAPWCFLRGFALAVAVTVVWSVVIQWGISAAFASIDFLFDVGFAPERYLELAVVIAGLFSTTFALFRIPSDFRQTVEPETFPKESRLLAQYVLVPLVSLYFLILYAYVIRVLVLWEWPKGTLAYMILGFSSLGVLVYIVLSPLRSSVAWIRRVGNGFFIALIPQIGMLFWALWFRISQYGVTENRYFVVVLGLWLLAIAFYFLRSKKEDIRVIPVSLFLLAIFSSFGPWGALAVSERSQINRLEHLLEKNGLLVDGKVVKATADVSDYDSREITGVIVYLNEVHGLDGIQQFFASPLSSLADKAERPGKIVKDLIGIKYNRATLDPFGRGNAYFTYSTKWSQSAEVIPVSGKQYVFNFYESMASTTVAGKAYTFKIVPEMNVLEVSSPASVIARIDLKPLLANLAHETLNREIPFLRMKMSFENEMISLDIHFTSLDGLVSDNGTYTVTSARGMVAFTLK
jgi:hypothetical protein